MFGVEEVKGEATEASSSDREIPLWALFKAWDREKEVHPNIINKKVEGKVLMLVEWLDFWDFFSSTFQVEVFYILDTSYFKKNEVLHEIHYV